MGAGAVAAAVAIIGAGVSATEQRRAAKASRKSEKARQRIAQAEQTRARNQQIREARIRRAQLISQAEATGVSGSSPAIGGAGSIQSQLGSNLGFLEFTRQQSQRASIFRGQAAAARSRAATAESVSNIASSLGGGTNIFK